MEGKSIPYSKIIGTPCHQKKIFLVHQRIFIKILYIDNIIKVSGFGLGSSHMGREFEFV